MSGRGQNENSLKALEENRAKGQFNAESAVIAAAASLESRRLRKSLREDLEEQATPERIAKINEKLLKLAESGNLKAYELLRDGLGERPSSKYETNRPMHEVIIIDDFSEP